MKAKLTLTAINKTYIVDIRKDTYQNTGALALEAYNEDGPFTTLSTNLPLSRLLPKNQCFFKNWSENEGMLEQLEEQGLIKQVGPSMQTGFVKAPLVEVLF